MNSVRMLMTEDGQFIYDIQPVEIKNALGVVKATVYAYSLRNETGEEYILYKTKDGTWYTGHDLPHSNNALLLNLKIALEKAG